MDQSRIGSFIMERRKEKGLTQAQLAERLNITDRAVSKWETGKSLPDSSIMLALCGILDITADQLLSGGREAPAAPAPSPPERGERRIPRRGERRWRLGLLLTGGLLTGALVCFICDTALCGALSWSRIVALSAGYAWAALFPLAALKRSGPAGSLLSLSLFTVPYLYGLSRLLRVRAVFTVGTAMAVISLLFLWLIYAVFKRRGRNAVSLGVACLLLAGLTASVNGALYLLEAAPPPDAWNGLSVVLFLLAAAVCFTWRRGGEEP
ncbi:helix-turn-helix domain-containing protein [Oscillibacter sp.]|uniref:helix-turn-helix domain-containing protein n=1 Tax=Oscillibacter sp. TaxID=1945593 RepID=UPI002D804FF6|nr:helix-turn-helix domain-containing protein [Oscillibacter sp.]